jgi:hypothetical protein
MKVSILALSVLFVAATAFAAPAPQATATKAPAHKAAASEKPKLLWASGTIEKYDAASKTLTVKHEGKESTFVVEDTTHVMRGKEALTASALENGQNAKIEYAMNGSNKTARVIELTPAKAAAAKPAKK